MVENHRRRSRDPRLLEFAHRMRREPTPFEVILWRHLSASQLGGFKFRRQAVLEPFVVDFLCPLRSLVVEVDGDTHDAAKDRVRDALLAQSGYRVLRFSNAQVVHELEGVLERILTTLKLQPHRFSETPHPNPSSGERCPASFRSGRGPDRPDEPEGEGLARAAALLADISDTPRLDAEVLLAHVLGVSREEVLARGLGDAPGFDALIQRRLTGEPIAYITGTRGFWTVDLEVTPDVLIPRPDSETLLDAAVAHFGKSAPRRVLDLGTGSGALLLAALDQWRDATGLGVDASAAALAVAARNGARIAPGRVEWRLGDWTAGVGEQFDLVLCNPPYVEDMAELGPGVREWEPHAALFAGRDGLACYRVLAGQVPRLIAPGGLACIELGAGQYAEVAALFETALPTPRSPVASRPPPASGRGFTISTRRDLGGHERCLTLTTSTLP